MGFDERTTTDDLEFGVGDVDGLETERNHAESLGDGVAVMDGI